MEFLAALFAYLHFGSIMLLAALATAEFMMLHRNLDAKSVEALSRTDIAYLTFGFIVLLSGAVRFGVSPLGVMYLGGNPLFWLKLMLFGALAMTALYVSWRYSRWVHQARMDLSYRVPAAETASALRLVKFQMALLALIPLLAVLVVRGIAR